MKDKKRRSPTFKGRSAALIELTNHCNFGCKFCPQSIMKRKKGMMDFNLAVGILDTLAEHKLVDEVILAGIGEPLLYPNLIEFLDHAKKNNLYTILYTNGSLLSEKLGTDVLSAGVARLFISLHTPTEVSFRELHSGTLPFESYLSRIKSAIEVKLLTGAPTEIVVSLMCTSTAHLFGYKFAGAINTPQEAFGVIHEWFHFGNKLAKKLGNTSIPSAPPQNPRDINPRKFCFQILPGIYIESKLLLPWGIGKQRIPALIGACPGLQSQFGILYNGDVVMCCEDYDGETSLGNLKEESLMDILTSDYTRRCKRLLQFCLLPTTFCRRCRGGSTPKAWAAMQIGSIVHHKLGIRVGGW